MLERICIPTSYIHTDRPTYMTRSLITITTTYYLLSPTYFVLSLPCLKGSSYTTYRPPASVALPKLSRPLPTYVYIVIVSVLSRIISASARFCPSRHPTSRRPWSVW
ncbi:hypothetical protein F4775DRAFT_322713 [Biscogniauxia sp. FL1348]|nr:hypothetical protein F4775DRAFT_322713 [Biscogniauxia sp. FL1348]